MPLFTYIPGTHRSAGRLIPVYLYPNDREFEFLLHHRYSITLGDDNMFQVIDGVIIANHVYMWPHFGLHHDEFIEHLQESSNTPWFTISKRLPSGGGELHIYLVADARTYFRHLQIVKQNQYIRQLVAKYDLIVVDH